MAARLDRAKRPSQSVHSHGNLVEKHPVKRVRTISSIASGKKTEILKLMKDQNMKCESNNSSFVRNKYKKYKQKTGEKLKNVLD